VPKLCYLAKWKLTNNQKQTLVNVESSNAPKGLPPPTPLPTSKVAAYNYTGSLSTRLGYKLVDASRVCPGVYKVRVLFK